MSSAAAQLPVERLKIVIPGRQRRGAGPRKLATREAATLIKRGLTNSEIQARIAISLDMLTYWRRICAEEDLSQMPCPDWVWPENRADYRRLACLPVADEGGRKAAEAWARQEQAHGKRGRV